MSWPKELLPLNHFRESRESDRRFILDSWVKSYKRSRYAGPIPYEDWSDIMTKVYADMLDRPGCQTYVCGNPKAKLDNADIYGWIATELGYEYPVVHYIYVKEMYRKEKVATGLLAFAGITPTSKFIYTHKTAVIAKLKSKVPFAEFDEVPARLKGNQ